MGTTQEASITIRAYDKASYAVLGVAANLETLNKRMARTSQIGYAFGQVGKQIAPAWERMQGLGEKWSAAFGRLSMIGLAAGGAAGGLLAFAKSAVTAVDNIGDLSARFGISSESLQVYGGLVEEAGGSMEDAATGIGKFKKAMGEALHGGQAQAEAFAGIGISVQQLKKMSPEEALLKMSEAFKGSNKDLEKHAVLLALMGKNGTIYRDVLNKGPEEIKKRLAEMRADGSILSKQQIADGDRLDNSFKRMEKTLGGLKNRLGLKLADRILGGKGLQQWLAGDGGKKIDEQFDKIFSKENITAFKDAMLGLWEVVKGIGGAFKWMINTLGPQTMMWIGFGIALAPVGGALASTARFMWSTGKAVMFLAKLIPGVTTGMEAFGSASLAALGPVAIAAGALLAVYKAISAYQRLSDLHDAMAKDTGLRNDKRAAYNSTLKSVGGESMLNATKNYDFQQLDTVMSGLERGGQIKPGTAARLSAMRTEVSGTVKVEVNTTNGQARVTDISKRGPVDIEASTGLMMAEH